MKTILKLAAGTLLTLELLAVGVAGEETIQMRGIKTAHFRALGAAEERLDASSLALAFAAPDEWVTYAKAQPAFLLEHFARAYPDLLTASDTHKAAALSTMAAMLVAAPDETYEHRSAMLVEFGIVDPLPQITEASVEWIGYLEMSKIERNLKVLLKTTAPDEWAAYEAAKTRDIRGLATAERAYETALLALAFTVPDELALHAEAAAAHFVVSLLGSDAEKLNVSEVVFSLFMEMSKAAPAAEWTAFLKASKAYKTVAYNTAPEAHSATADDWRLYLRVLDIKRKYRALLKTTVPDEWTEYEAGRKGKK